MVKVEEEFRKLDKDKMGTIKYVELMYTFVLILDWIS